MTAADSALRARSALRAGEQELSLGRAASARAWLESAAFRHSPPATPWSRRAARLLAELDARAAAGR